ncbi:unnamed protein product, partial [Closterium sp. NIES-54]
EQVTPVIFRLRLPASWKIQNAFHVQLLKPYQDPNKLYTGRQPPPPPPVLVNDELEYEVEYVLAHRRRRHGALEFLVRWKGYDPSEDSWVSEEDMTPAAPPAAPTPAAPPVAPAPAAPPVAPAPAAPPVAPAPAAPLAALAPAVPPAAPAPAAPPAAPAPSAPPAAPAPAAPAPPARTPPGPTAPAPVALVARRQRRAYHSRSRCGERGSRRYGTPGEPPDSAHAGSAPQDAAPPESAPPGSTRSGSAPPVPAPAGSAPLAAPESTATSTGSAGST